MRVVNSVCSRISVLAHVRHPPRRPFPLLSSPLLLHFSLSISRTNTSYHLDPANTQNPVNPPITLLPLGTTLNLTLLLSSTTTSSPIAPLAYPLGSLSLPPSSSSSSSSRRHRHDLPPLPNLPAFRAQGLITPTIPAPQAEVPVLISLIGVGATLAPWLVLVSLLRALSSSSLTLTRPAPMSFLFVNCLLLIELLLATYWVCLRLYHLLPLFAALALATAYVGKTALRGLKEPQL